MAVHDQLGRMTMSTDTLRHPQQIPLRTGYGTTRQLLQKAAKNPGPVSVFIDGSGWDDADSAMFIVKGRDLAHEVYAALAEAGLVTPGQPVVP